MSASTLPYTSTSGAALAAVVAAVGAERFAPTTRLHDRALFELSELARRGELTLDTESWRFMPSADGGYAFVGLGKLFLILSEEGWLQRDHAGTAYVVSQEFQAWGCRTLSTLSAAERLRVDQVARRWLARASVSSKKPA